MRLRILTAVLVLVMTPVMVIAQLSDSELNRRVAAAQEEDADLPELLQGAAAARLLANHETAEDILADARGFLNGATGVVVNEMILQAMASGVPVLASGVGGIYSLVQDGRTGALVPSGNAHALASAILNLLKDDPLRLEMARNARDHVEKEFSSDGVATRVLEYYESLMDNGGF